MDIPRDQIIDAMRYDREARQTPKRDLERGMMMGRKKKRSG